jgi:Prophage tail length tape measure protein
MADDLKPLMVSVEANLNKLTKQMAQAAKIGSDAAKSIDKSFTSANDNIAKSYDKAAKSGTVSLGQQQAAAQNLHYQLHQIATTLAGGMSPFEVMAQQGFQVVDALEQAGKGAGIFEAIGGAVTRIINPLSIVTFGTIYLLGVTVDYFMKLAGGTAAAIKAIDDQISHIDGMAKAYKNSIPELTDYLDKLKEIKDQLEATQNAPKARADVIGRLQDTLTAMKAAVGGLQAYGEFTLGQKRLAELQQIRNALDDMEKAAHDGTLKVEDLTNVFQQLDDIMASVKDKTMLRDLPDQVEKAKNAFKEMTKEAGPALEGIKKAIDPDAAAVEKYTKAMKDMGAVTVQQLTKAEQIEKAYKEAIAAATEEINVQTRALHERAAEIQRNNQLTQLQNEAVTQLGGAIVGADQNDIERIIGQIESGNRDIGYRPGGGPGTPDTASGRYQFLDSTFLNTMKEIKEYANISKEQLLAQKNDPAMQKIAMEQILKDYAAKLISIQKDAGDVGNLYIMHLLGATGGARLLQAAPGSAAAQAIDPQSIAKNKWIMGGGPTVQDVINTINARVKKADVESGGGSHDYAATIANIEKETKALEDQNKAAGVLTDSYDNLTYQKEKVAKVDELTNAAKKQGIVLSDEDKKTIDATADAYAKAAAVKAFYTKETKDAQKQEQVHAAALKATAQQIAQYRDTFASLATDFVTGFIGDLKNGVKAVDALKNALGRLADQLLSMALNTLFKEMFSAVFPGGTTMSNPLSVLGIGLHSGGVVGQGGTRRSVPAMAFAGAPRLHNGLAGDEMPAILQRGETVLPKGYSAGGSTSISTSVGNISIDMSGTGMVAADTDSGRRFGENIRKLVQHEMVAQSRPGGLLTAPGSGGRVGR